tara:strand:+ start:3987 stop:4196 length:210 start_codon:yes stop_codon:yes gene_type:complete
MKILDGKKTIIGLIVILIPILAGFFGYEVSSAFPVESARFAEEVFVLVGTAIALYGRAVAKSPMWFRKK